jgi:ubiquinone/menaquinone biosynthesis C-methylase UbiE
MPQCAISDVLLLDQETAIVSLTSILKCPLTGSALALTVPPGLDAIRRQAAEGVLVHPDGTAPQPGFDCFLQTADGRLYYPVLDGIFVLLPSLALVRQEDRPAFAGLATESQTLSVMRFYDQIGWREAEGGSFRDADLFEDLRPVSQEYIHRCHLRINRYLSSGGEFLLDIASGPIQYPEYLTYSAGFRQRICCDVSLAALRAAKERLGPKGFYLQCDVTCIPLKDRTVDGLVSLHTIYHVPAERQIMAFREIERVLKSDASAVVVYTWGDHCRAMRLLMISPIRALRAFARRLMPREAVRAALSSQSGAQMDAQLYFRPHGHDWFAANVAANGHWRLYVWRSVSVPFLRRFVRARFFGAAILKVVFRLEEWFPYHFGRYGQYPLMVFRRRGRGSVGV